LFLNKQYIALVRDKKTQWKFAHFFKNL